MGRAIVLGLCLAAAAFASAEERAAEARAQFDEGRFEEALAAWTEVIRTYRAHDLVTFAIGDLECRALAVPGAHEATMWMRWPAACLHWFDGVTGRRLETDGRDTHA